MLWSCVHCGKRMKVPPTLLGKRGKCPQCKQIIDFPEAAPTPTSKVVVEEKLHWTKRRFMDVGAAITGAIIFHILAIGLFLAFAGGPAPAGPQEKEVGIATLPATEDLDQTEDQKFDDKQVDQAKEDFSETQMEIAPVMPGSDSADLAGPSFAMSSAGAALDTAAFGGAGGSGKGGGASFMGSRGRGNRICIIADRSGSMGGAKLEYTKTKLMDTIRGMRGGTKFFVVFFDDVPEGQPGGGWLNAPQEASRLTTWVDSIFANGSTEPGPAFKLAFGLKPRPDVIFFMTDGVFNPEYIEAIKKMNTPGASGKRTTINTIALLDRAGERLLKQIAEENHGTYTYVRNFRGE